MVTCPRMKNTFVPERTCIARQVIIKRGQQSYLQQNQAYRDSYNSCFGCPVGLDLLKRSGETEYKSKEYQQRLQAAAKRRENMEKPEKQRKNTDPAAAAHEAGGVIATRVCNVCGKKLAECTGNFKARGRGYSKTCQVCEREQKTKKPVTAANGDVKKTIAGKPLIGQNTDINISISVSIAIRFEGGPAS